MFEIECVRSVQEAVLEQDLPRAAAEGAGGRQLLQHVEALRHPRARAHRHLLRYSSHQVNSQCDIFLDGLIFTSSHLRTIDENTEVSNNDGRENAIRSLILEAVMETTIQLYMFVTNPALRSVKKNYRY